MNEDLKHTGLKWKDAKSVAGNRTKWRTLVANVPDAPAGTGRTMSK